MESNHFKSKRNNPRMLDSNKSINIKKEDSLHPMSYYINDRIELVRQIFSTLRPKTILNFTPDYLKELELDKIEQCCLDELLGISKKRIIAAINGTRCSSNTDSSDDSDHEAISDCISLEQISSDSCCETAKSKTTTKNKKSTLSEILELEAKAKEIRSQLALEPITKIEIDLVGCSSKNNNPNSSDSDSTNLIASNLLKKKRVTSPSGKNIKKSVPETIKTTSSRKRSYRDVQKKNKMLHALNTINTVSSVRKQIQSNIVPSKVILKNEINSNLRKLSSEDMAIVQSPEAWTISESSDENENRILDAQTKIIEILSEPEDGEIIKSSDNEEKGDEKRESIDNDANDITIISDHEDNVKETKKIENSMIELPTIVEKREEMKKSENVLDEDSYDGIVSLQGDDLVNEISGHFKETKSAKRRGLKSKKHLSKKHTSKVNPQNSIANSVDVINADGKSDIKNHLIINQEGPKTWKDRWLNSSKVSKMLISSKISNRLRLQMKEKNKMKLVEKEKKEAEKIRAKNEASVSQISNYDEGSVEQYKAILEQSTNNHKS